jgi:hypothetical protein
MSGTPWLARLLLLDPGGVQRNLERARKAGIVQRTPNAWQLTLGILRMWHRIAFRFDTIGTSRAHAVRPTWRARVLRRRPLRLPFLLAERAIAPWDLTGLLSPPERILRHLLAAHHDGAQAAYDLEILSAHEGRLEELRERARAIVEQDTPRARWLRDLTVFERYHEELLALVERRLAGEPVLSLAAAADPDISFAAYVDWCARQPATPEATWRAWREGRFRLGEPQAPRPSRRSLSRARA